MTNIISLDGSDYDLEKFSEQARVILKRLQFCNSRMQELNNMKALLTRAKNSYAESLKKEILSAKAGLVLGD